MKQVKTKERAGTIGPVSNGAENLVEMEREYVATVKITGTATLLLHGWNIEAIEEKQAAKKNSAKKKTDDIESYLYRDKSGNILMPCKNFCAGIRCAGKKYPDPTSPRKSMHDLLRAIVVPYEEHALVNGGTDKYDFIDRQRAVVQRAGITRSRPAFYPGWTMEFKVMVLEPEYLSPALLNEIITRAGKLEGIGDFRPTYGRFQVVKFEIEEL